MNKLLLAAIIIVGLGTAYYSLYQYNYNEAKDTMSLVMPEFILVYAQEHELTQEEFDRMLNATMSIAKSKQKMMEKVMFGPGERIIIDTGISYYAQTFPVNWLYSDMKQLAFLANDKEGTTKVINFLLLEHEYQNFTDSEFSHTLYSYEGERKHDQIPDVMLEFANYTKLDEETHDDIINTLGSYYDVSIG